MKVRMFTSLAFTAAAMLLLTQCDGKTGTDENPAGQSIDNTNGNTDEEGYRDNTNDTDTNYSDTTINY